MAKFETIFETDTLTLTKREGKDEFWLWCEVAEMNVSMRAKTEREALVEGLAYYQQLTTSLKALLAEERAKLQKVAIALGVEEGCDCRD